MKNVITLFALIFVAVTAPAQDRWLRGTVTDSLGNPLPFGSIYINNTSRGTSANEKGFYQLKLNTSANQVVFKFIGYNPVLVTIPPGKADTSVHVQLSQTVYQLDHVTVTGKKSNTANRIMRMVIDNRIRHLEEIRNYVADVYIKGMQKLTRAPKRFLGQDVTHVLQLDSNGHGIIYLSESESKLHFQAPNNYREVMLASRVSGKNSSFSFHKAEDLMVNFYQNLIQFDSLAIRGFISPLADYAFAYYRYKLLGQITENGETISKIAVIPRRAHDPVFRGEIYIAEHDWRLYAVNLYLTKKNNINLADTIRFSQQYLPASDNIWMPSSLQLSFKGKVLGFSYEGYFVGIFNNYKINEPQPGTKFSGEILKISKNAIKKSESYWEDKRPIPLTKEEIRDYRQKDSIEHIRTLPRYRDSIMDVENRLTLAKAALFGYTWKNTLTGRSLRFAPVLPSLFYNTVEGFGFQYDVRFKKEYNLKNSIEVTPQLRYGFSNKHLNPLVEGRYYYDPVNKGFLSLRAGSEVLDLTNLRSSTSVTNSLNTLIYETNWRKFYEQSLLSFSASYETNPGLFLMGGLEYSRRRWLNNTSNFRLIDHPGKSFTSNNPFYPDDNTIPLFANHTAFIFSAELDYAPAARYITRPEGRFYEPFKYPRFLVNYKKGINDLFNSDVGFDFASLEVYQNDLKLGLLGRASYTFKTGKFFNAASIYYPDYYHYRGNNSLIFESSLRNFHYLDIYRFSTRGQFFEAHYEQNFGGFITNKLPLIRRLKLEEIVGGAYLDQSSQKNYAEVFFGLQRLIFRVDYAVAFSYGVKVYHGFKLSYRLK
ncbi:carboxypeptidase-like regulatory domain-containing protein [Pedobacter sp. BS3]|uniref:DUF5686 and carboxypeptidase regulatory-like domain-containing protein n=1 Tax=Pedobacter sp. BS3 TaxID=2567937 RepID=UPI0011EFD187|nr:DUF5686 and carboxypeptidase regulatory-like domain-containing protein [Pedobacter sp. BS3]TZF82150.1 carboxypeptidase-like regulatory domain-containing protein [Pedobacter sp. BS3]